MPQWDISSVALAQLESELQALEASGARAFDSASCDCVRTLITRAGALQPTGAQLLAARAQAHMARLRERFDRARERAEQRLEVAEDTFGALPTQRAALARGDVSTVRRSLRRFNSVPPRLAGSALARGDVERERGRRANEYEAALAELVTSMALARAVDVVPEHAGPYNPLRIASDLLARIRTVSPIYLTAQLKRLDELASMLSLPELPELPSKAALQPRKHAPARSSTSRAPARSSNVRTRARGTSRSK